MLQVTCERALIIAPHPDDEIFGCGGIIHQLKQRGTKIYVMFMTVGTTKDLSARGVSTADERMKEIEKVAQFMGFDGWSMALAGDQYHLQLDAVPQKELVHVLERGNEVSLERCTPDMVFTPSNSDYNQDHRAVFTATITATRPVSSAMRSFQPAVLTYELPYHQWNIAETLPNPALLCRLSEADLKAKLDAISFYGSQLKNSANPLSHRGIEVLARYRGLQCDSPAAEAFQIARFAFGP